MQLCESPSAFLLPPTSSSGVTGRILAAESYSWQGVRQKGSPFCFPMGVQSPRAAMAPATPH